MRSQSRFSCTCTTLSLTAHTARPAGIIPTLLSSAPRSSGWPKGDLQRVYRRFFDGDTSVVIEEKDLAHLRDLYDEEIRFFDEQFEELVGELNARDLLGRTIVLLVSGIHSGQLVSRTPYGGTVALSLTKQWFTRHSLHGCRGFVRAAASARREPRRHADAARPARA